MRSLSDVVDLTPTPFRPDQLWRRDKVAELDRRILAHEEAAARAQLFWLDSSDELFCASQLRRLRDGMLAVDRTPPCGVQALPDREQLESPKLPRFSAAGLAAAVVLL